MDKALERKRNMSSVELNENDRKISKGGEKLQSFGRYRTQLLLQFGRTEIYFMSYSNRIGTKKSLKHKNIDYVLLSWFEIQSSHNVHLNSPILELKRNV